MRETKEMANESGEFFLFPRGRGSVTWRGVVASRSADIFTLNFIQAQAQALINDQNPE